MTTYYYLKLSNSKRTKLSVTKCFVDKTKTTTWSNLKWFTGEQYTSEVKQMAYHFNNRISIIGITEEINDEGGFEEIEAEIAKPWADIKTMRASEFEAMGFSVTNVPIRFIIRYRKGIELDHKIKYNGDMYKIESIENDDGKNYTLTIFANRNEM